MITKPVEVAYRLRIPAWWTDRHQASWNRIAADLRREWTQILCYVSRGKVGAGPVQATLPFLSKAEPAGVSTGVAWDDVQYAIRFGFAEADLRPYEPWTDRIARELESRWRELPAAPPWDQAIRHVRTGWRYRRSRLSR